jgi:hypothetical protein
MNKKIIRLVATCLLVAVRLADAQENKKISRIGYLSAASRAAIADRFETFKQGLTELG